MEFVRFKMIQKILTIIIIAVIPQVVIANEMYIKGGVGLNHITQTTLVNNDYKSKVKPLAVFPLVEAGAGYFLSDTIRLELLFDYYFQFFTLETITDTAGNEFNVLTRAKANTLMLNLYKDFTSILTITPFIGAGVGIATVKSFESGYAVEKSAQTHYNLATTSSTAAQIAYKLTFGLSRHISDSITAEISYNYYNLGFIKAKMVKDIYNVNDLNRGINNLTFNLRFAI